MDSLSQQTKFRDLVYFVVRSWRVVLVFALSGALILSIVAYLLNTTYNKANNLEEEIQLTDKEIEEIKKDLETNNLDAIKSIEKIDSLKKQADTIEDRLNNSIYLAINENSQPVSKFNVNIEINESAGNAAYDKQWAHYLLATDYFKIAKSNSFINYLASNNDLYIPTQWLKELVDIKLLEDNQIFVEITAIDIASVKVLTDNAIEFFKQEIKNNLSLAFPHTINISNAWTGHIKNQEIKNSRLFLEEDVEKIIRAIEEEENSIEDLFELAIEEEVAKQETVRSLSSNTAPKSITLYAIIGLLIGVLLATLIIAYKNTANDLIRYPEDFADQLGILYLGSLVKRDENVNKKLGSKLDALIENVFKRKNEYFQDGEDQLNYLSSLINGLILQNKDGNLEREFEDGAFQLAIIGYNETIFSENLTTRFNRYYADSRRSIKAYPVSLDQEEGINAMKRSHAFIIVVHSGHTKMKRTLRDIKIAMKLGVEPLGIVNFRDFDFVQRSEDTCI